jgi:hypothetical protein
MSEKKLKISLDLDDKAFNSAIKRMQDQLNQINTGPALIQQQRQISQKMQSLGLGGLPGAPNDRQMEQSQQKAKQQSDKMFEETRRKFDIIKRLQGDLNKEQLDGVSSEQRKLEIKEKLLNLTEKEKRATGELRAQVERYNVQTQQQNKQKDTASGIGAMAKGGAWLGGAIAGVGAAIGGIGRLQVDASAAAGSAVSYLVGQQLKDMTDPSHMSFLPERSKALAAAQKAWKASRVEDQMLNAAGGIATAIGMMAAGGALTSTGIGAGPGLALMAGGLTTMLATPTQRAIFTGDKNAYEKLSSKDLADLAQQSITGAENEDPFKKLAADYNAQNYQRNLGIQRGLGLSDQGFRGKNGFLQGNMGYGGNGMQFTEEQVTGMQQNILGAGGSARMGREAGYGLQLEKDYNLTNASQILGSLSKTMGGAAQTKEATARVMATAFKDGLNDSELVDLFRSFTGTAAQFIAAAGAKTAQDAARISDQFGKGLAENTGAGVEGAKNAYEAYKQLSGARSGTFSVLKRAAMIRDPKWSRLMSMGAEGSKIFEAAVGAEDPATLRLAAESAAYKFNKGKKPGDTGYTTVESLMDSQANNIGASGSLDSSMPGYRAIIRKWEQDNGIPIGKALASGIPVPEDVRQAAVMAGQTLNTPGIGAYAGKLKTAQDIMAAGVSFTSGDITHPNMVLGGGAGTETKDADKVNANIATTQQAFIDNWESFGKSLTPTAGHLDDVNKQLLLFGQIIMDINNGKKPKSDLANAILSKGPQPQANSSSAGPPTMSVVQIRDWNNNH